MSTPQGGFTALGSRRVATWLKHLNKTNRDYTFVEIEALRKEMKKVKDELKALKESNSVKIDDDFVDEEPASYPTGAVSEA